MKRATERPASLGIAFQDSRASEPSREALARQRAEAVAEVEAFDARVIGVDLEVHRDASRRAHDLDRVEEHRAADAAIAQLGDDVELVEPRREPAVLDGPRERHDG